MSLLLETFSQHEPLARLAMKGYYGNKIPSALPGDIDFVLGHICMCIDNYLLGFNDESGLNKSIQENLESHDRTIELSEVVFYEDFS